MDMRAFAGDFGDLQDARQRADYDPAASFSLSGAVKAVTLAETAMARFDRIPDDERADVLALMLLNPRA